MNTIYRKTEKGQTEIETRLFRLMPRMRTALILVDGHRSDAELAKLIPGDPVVSLQTLLDQGFIEVAATVEPRSPPRAQPAADVAGRAPVASSTGFEQRKRDAIRALNDQLGPEAEGLAIRMEKCRDWSQLLPALQIARQVLINARGAAAAGDFGSRFIDSPLG